MSASAEPRITLIGRDGCHMCDQARAVVEGVAAETGDSIVERDIDQDPVLHDRYWEQIPVVLVDGRQIAFWTVDPDRLRAALAGRGRSRRFGRST
jgi:hypothetical protein